MSILAKLTIMYITNTSSGVNAKNKTSPIISSRINSLFLFNMSLYDKNPRMTGVNIIANMNHIQSRRDVNPATLKLNRLMKRYISRTVRKNP